MFNPDRAQVRTFFCVAWQKFQSGEPLQAAEQNAVAIIVKHPEYHALLETKAMRELELQEWQPEAGQMNPFLHLSLHLAIDEQLAIDQPPGVRSVYEDLLHSRGEEHEAKHLLLETLGECLWSAQGNPQQLDAQAYLERARQLC